MKQYAALDDTVYFWFAANDTSGSGGDGASPAADVRLAGAAADAAPVYSPTPALLSHASYPAGAYEIAIAATAANGFAINNTYAIFCTLAIDAQNPTGFVGSFDLKPIKANVTQIGDAAQSATDLKDLVDTGYDPANHKIQSDLIYIHGSALTETAGQIAAAFTKLFDVATPLLVASDVMRGTDSANTTTPPTVNAIADQVWDEILTGALHNTATSAGRRLRELSALSLHSGTAQSGTSTTITLAAGADGGDGIYNRNLIIIIGGTGAGQTRTIADYNNTTKVCVIDRNWRINPDATSEYQILADDTPLVVDQGIAQAGTATTITLRDYASSINDTYLCNIVIIIGGTGRGQARLVGGYNGTSKVITLCGDNWITNPDNTSVYVVIPYGTTCASCMGTSALAQINTEVDTVLNTAIPASPGADSVNERVKAIDILSEASGNGDLAAILADTNELQTDWANGGRLDLIIDALALEATLTAMKGSGFLTGTDSLEAIRNRGDAAWVGGGSAADIADAVWDELQSGHTSAGSFGKYLDAAISGVGGVVGSGALSCTWTQKDEGGTAMDNVQVWISTDEAGNNVVAGTLITNASGEVTFMLDAGTYYVFRERAGYNFTNPQEWAVS